MEVMNFHLIIRLKTLIIILIRCLLIILRGKMRLKLSKITVNLETNNMLMLILRSSLIMKGRIMVYSIWVKEIWICKIWVIKMEMVLNFWIKVETQLTQIFKTERVIDLMVLNFCKKFLKGNLGAKINKLI